MNIYKTSLIAPAFALLLSSNLNAEELYTVQKQSLKEAIELISKQSKKAYMVNGKLLKGKKAPNIKNIKGLENALKGILKDTNLEASIEEGTILIKEKRSIETNSNNNLGEVIITGTKLNKSLQETVESVQVFDEVDVLNSAKMNDLYDIFEQSSNISTDGGSILSIRGITSAGNAGSPIGPRTIDINIDGVSQSGQALRKDSMSTWDLEQVEILKGSQSTTQGRNSLAGAIILKTKSPEFDANGAAKIDYSTNNTSRLSVVQTGPVTDKLAFRISAQRSESDGFLKNDNIREDKFNQSESLNIRGKLLYQFDNGTDAILTLNKVKTDESGTTNIPGSLDPFERKNNWNTDGYINSDVKSYSLEINQPLNTNWSAKIITAYTDSDYKRKTDEDGGETSSTKNILDRDVTDFSQEFRFSYKEDNVNALFGLYLASGSGINNNDISDFEYNGILLDFQNDISEDYKNMALFTNIDYELTNNLTLIAGLRIDRDDRDNSSATAAQRSKDYSTDNDALVDYLVNSGTATNETVAQLIIAGRGGTSAFGSFVNSEIDTLIKTTTNSKIEEDNSTTNILPKLGLNYKWNNHINTGILFSQGYRPGGISINITNATSESFDAESTDNLEFSFKSKWLENALAINANVFYTKYKDIQVVETLNSGDVHITNAAKASLKGIEIDVKYLVSEELDIYGNIGYIKTKFEDYDGFTDNEFRYSPSITGTLGATYRHQLGYFIGGNVTYRDDSYASVENDVTTKSYTLTNMKVGYERDDWSMYVYVNNLFDREYLLRNANSSGTYKIGNPRTVGITLAYSW